MFRFDLSEQMTAIIATALGNHPYREAAPVINELQRQIRLQQAPAQTNGSAEQAEVDRP